MKFDILSALLGFVAFPTLIVAAVFAYCTIEDFRRQWEWREAKCMFWGCDDRVKKGYGACTKHVTVPCELFLLKHPWGGNYSADTPANNELRRKFWETYKA